MGQVHTYFNPGTVWTVTMIQMTSGMDQMYLQYLDISFKKSEDAQVKAGFQKSYKILRTLDDSGTWNLLSLREYTSLASMEANVEKADTLSQQSVGSDEAQMQGYQDRSKYRGRRHEVRPRADPEVGDPTQRSRRLRTDGRLDPIPPAAPCAPRHLRRWRSSPAVALFRRRIGHPSGARPVA